MRTTLPLLAALLTLTVLATTGGAHASTKEVEDPDDALGKLDVAVAVAGHDGALLTHTLRMQENWSSKVLKAGTATLFFRIGDRDRTLNLDYRDGVLVGEICTEADDSSFSQCSRNVGLDRTNRRSIEVTLPRRLLKRGLSSYSWSVVTLLNQGESGCTEIVCVDSVPDDQSFVKHRL